MNIDDPHVLATVGAAVVAFFDVLETRVANLFRHQVIYFFLYFFVFVFCLKHTYVVAP